MGSANGSPNRRAALIGLGVAGLAVLVWLFLWWWQRLPQMGADEEVFKTVDALFTAVTARDEKLVADCGRRLHACRDEGALPLAASEYLDVLMSQARAGEWQSAAERLYEFIAKQHRAVAQPRRSRRKVQR